MATKKKTTIKTTGRYEIDGKSVTFNEYIRDVFIKHKGLYKFIITKRDKFGCEDKETVSADEFIRYIECHDYGQTEYEKEKLLEAYEKYSIIGYEAGYSKIIDGYIASGYYILTVRYENYPYKHDMTVVLPASLPVNSVRKIATDKATERNSEMERLKNRMDENLDSRIHTLYDRINSVDKRLSNVYTIFYLFGSSVALIIIILFFIFK